MFRDPDVSVSNIRSRSSHVIDMLVAVSTILVLGTGSAVLAQVTQQDDGGLQVQTSDVQFKVQAIKLNAGEQIVSIPAAAFRPTYDEFKYRNNGWMLARRRADTHASASFVAPLMLPHGATLRRMVMFCEDPYRAIKIEVQLMRLANDGREPEEIGNLHSYGAEEGKIRRFETRSFASDLIDNTRYCYYLRAPLNGGAEFRGLKVVYVTP